MPHHTDRLWPLQGASNFRDLGGYIGQDGRPLRWRCLFRSDHLGALTPADRAKLEPLGLRRALDFRGVSERAATPYDVAGVVQHSLAIEPSVSQRMQERLAAGRTIDVAEMVSLMEELYRAFVNDESHRYAQLFEHVLEADGPLLFHCTAGKDRTGFGAAMILLALGVSRETVMRDYLLTNEHYKHPSLNDGMFPRDVLAVLWRVQRGFLDAALRVIDRDHGGIDRYLQQRLRVGAAARAALVDAYLARG